MKIPHSKNYERNLDRLAGGEIGAACGICGKLTNHAAGFIYTREGGDMIPWRDVPEAILNGQATGGSPIGRWCERKRRDDIAPYLLKPGT